MSITATPQANLLIDTLDVLSPDFGILVDPGKGYCGLDVYHSDTTYTRKIPDSETSLLDDGIPQSFIDAISMFFVACAIYKNRGMKPGDKLSMLIHPSQLKADHEKVFKKVIIYRNDFPVIFRQSDFVIVVPEAVLGIIEVKSRITGATQLTQVVDKLSVAAEIVCKPIFSGIFSFEGYDGILNRNVNQQVRSTLIRSNGKANHLCIGENCFIKYWPEYAPTRENTRSRYSFYKIDDLAFGYFISNLVEDVYIATVGTNLPETLTSMFYPIENTKEAYKLTEVSMEM